MLRLAGIVGTSALAVVTVACGADRSSTGVSPDDPLAYTTRPRVVTADLVPFVNSDIAFTTIVERPGDEHLFAVDQDGRILRVGRPTLDDLADDGTFTELPLHLSTLDDVVLDIVDQTERRGEEGLIGLAFDGSGELAYIHQSRLGDGVSVISEYRVEPDGYFDSSTRRELLEISQFSWNHNGGQLLFGPDGLLYLGFGDGSGASDSERLALDLSVPHGKILRIDPTPNGDSAYSIPRDNPFVGVDGADPRIWSLGLRNPFSFSFDSATGDMWIADVGQANHEEVNLSFARAGRDAGRGVDYGWSAFEGFAQFNVDQVSPDHQPPRFTYEHPDPVCGAVADGLVVRDSRIPLLDGWYTYGDWCSGLVWARDTLQLDAEPVVLDTMPGFTQMLQTADGNLYASSQLGTIALVTPG